jgi:hypothetical protein
MLTENGPDIAYRPLSVIEFDESWFLRRIEDVTSGGHDLS